MKTSTKAKASKAKVSKAKVSKAKATITDTANNISDSMQQALASIDWNKDIVEVGAHVGQRQIHISASPKELLQATGIAAAVAGVCYLVMK